MSKENMRFLFVLYTLVFISTFVAIETHTIELGAEHKKTFFPSVFNLFARNSCRIVISNKYRRNAFRSKCEPTIEK